tara:strand:- start:3854 stop:4234 length:381 start_codon:yes stop_codon:yes gene_type:complete
MGTFKKTKSLKLILDSFKDKKALTIIELVDKFCDKMNKTTVYRILDRLEQSDLVHSFVDQNGLKRYARNNKNNNSLKLNSTHSHFMCEDCGDTQCIYIDVNLPEPSKYTVKNSEHLLIGHCNNCMI